MASEPAAPSRRRAAFIYASTVVLGLLLLQLVLRLGDGLRGPRPTASAGSAPASAPTGDLVWRLLLASAVIITVPRLVGALFVRTSCPRSGSSSSCS